MTSGGYTVTCLNDLTFRQASYGYETMFIVCNRGNNMDDRYKYAQCNKLYITRVALLPIVVLREDLFVSGYLR